MQAGNFVTTSLREEDAQPLFHDVSVNGIMGATVSREHIGSPLVVHSPGLDGFYGTATANLINPVNHH